MKESIVLTLDDHNKIVNQADPVGKEMLLVVVVLVVNVVQREKLHNQLLYLSRKVNS
jgi:hypothetical protein